MSYNHQTIRYLPNSSVTSMRSHSQQGRQSTEVLMHHLNNEKQRNQKLQAEIEKLTDVIKSRNTRIVELERQNQELRELMMMNNSSVVGNCREGDHPLLIPVPQSTILIGLQTRGSRVLQHENNLGLQIQSIPNYQPQQEKPVTPMEMDDSVMVQSATDTDQPAKEDLREKLQAITTIKPEWSPYIKKSSAERSSNNTSTATITELDNTKYSNGSSNVRLFECFMVVTAAETSKSGCGNFQPKVVYTYPEGSWREKVPQIEKLSFPLGVTIKNINTPDQARRILEDEAKENSFFTLRVDANNSSLGPMDKPAQNNLLAAVNPGSSLLYAITLKVRGFARTPNNKLFYQTPKCLIFLTYLPFIDFFHRLLREVNNTLKSDELEKLPQISRTVCERLIPTILDDMSKVAISGLSTNVRFKWLNDNVPLAIPDRRHVDQLVVKFALESLRTLELGTLTDIYLFALLETPVHLYSTNQSYLSQIILLVLTAIKPFRYGFPVVYGLPLSDYSLLESPLARIVGISIPEDKFKQLFEVQPRNAVYFNLDQNVVHRHPKRKQHLLFKNELIAYLSAQQMDPLTIFKRLNAFTRKQFVQGEIAEPNSPLALLQRAFYNTEMARAYRRTMSLLREGEGL